MNEKFRRHTVKSTSSVQSQARASPPSYNFHLHTNRTISQRQICIFMLSSSRAFIVVCDSNFSSDFDCPGPDCSAIHAIARDGSCGLYTLDTACDIPPIMQLLGCSAFGGAVSGFPEGSGDSFTAR